MKRIAIIGAGLAGLTCARQLKAMGHQVAIFEKSRGIGGRLATRRAEPFYFDHGADTFTATHGDFKALIQALIEQGIVAKWQPIRGHLSAKSGMCEANDRQTLYVGIPAMNAIGKHLANGLNVQRNTRVVSIVNHHSSVDTWELLSDTGESLGQFDWVVLAMPVEQVKSFAQTSCHSDVLSQYELKPCSVLMLGFDQPLDLAWQLAEVDDNDITKIIVNSAKPNRQGGFSLVIHSTPQWTDANIDDDKAACIANLIASASRLLDVDLSVATHKDIHHWRYATGKINPQQSGFLLDKAQHIGVCGDWLQSGDVESAYLSGLQLSKAIIQALKN